MTGVWTGRQILSIQPSTPEDIVPLADARVAQLVEHATENRSVGGSTPSPGTILFPLHWYNWLFSFFFPTVIGVE